MLKNISKDVLYLQWGGKAVSVSPGLTLSVEVEFGAKDKEIVALEDRFLSKFKGQIAKGTFIVQDEPIVVEEVKPEPKKVVFKRTKNRKK